MRMKLKLSKESEELLKYYKKVYYDVEGYNASLLLFLIRLLKN